MPAPSEIRRPEPKKDERKELANVLASYLEEIDTDIKYDSLDGFLVDIGRDGEHFIHPIVNIRGNKRVLAGKNFEEVLEMKNDRLAVKVNWGQFLGNYHFLDETDFYVYLDDLSFDLPWKGFFIHFSVPKFYTVLNSKSVHRLKMIGEGLYRASEDTRLERFKPQPKPEGQYDDELKGYVRRDSD